MLSTRTRGSGPPLHQLADQLQAPSAAQAQVEDDEVGPRLLGQRQRLAHGVRLAHDLQVRLLADRRPQPGAAAMGFLPP
jgi:hypothetical protein